MAEHNIEMGKSGSLSGMRKHLLHDLFMLQVWAGKSEGDTDYIVFIGAEIEEFVILTSPGGSSVYTITEMGDIVFMHSKNLRKLARMNDK